MPSYKIEVYVPFMLPFSMQKVSTFFQEALFELTSLSGDIELISDTYGSAKVNINTVDAGKFNEILDFPNEIAMYSEVVLFSASINSWIKKEEITSSANKPLSEADHEYLIKVGTVNDYVESIYDFLVAVQLAKPGFVHSKAGFILVNDKYYGTTKQLTSPLRETYDYINQHQWPELKLLKIKEVWKWIQEDMKQLHSFSRTPVQRALHAFTYLFEGWS
jgi:hypothetical protein